MKIVLFLCLTSCLLLAVSCPTETLDRDFRHDMRNFVQGISEYAKGINPDFIIIPQNGHDLVTEDSEPDGQPDLAYLGAIDGQGQEDLFYGYYQDDVATPAEDTDEIISYLDIAEANGVQVLVTDYCWTTGNVDDSYESNNVDNPYISFAADSRELDDIPLYPNDPYHDNPDAVNSLADAKNFLYFINPDVDGTESDFIDAMDATNYDLFIIDLFFEDNELDPDNIAALQQKPNDASRLAIAYMSIGEAEDYRYYWQPGWNSSPPDWIEEENPDWEGNYVVRYWEKEWQDIIYGNDDSYLKKIIDAGFDGVYLDIIDAFEYFEENY